MCEGACIGSESDDGAAFNDRNSQCQSGGYGRSNNPLTRVKDQNENRGSPIHFLTLVVCNKLEFEHGYSEHLSVEIASNEAAEIILI